MNEDFLVGSELSEESVEILAESVETGTDNSENSAVTDIDSGSGSGSVSVDNSLSDISIVFPETYYNSELGGYPVVIVNNVSDEVMVVADYADYYMTFSDVWIEYYSGVLANIGNTDYVAYCLRDYADSSDDSYVDHYIMYYDLQIENDSLVAGAYPYMDIYRENSSSGYICETGMAELLTVPFPAYGSFGNLSDIRKGAGHNEVYAILFAVGFATVYSVCTRIFGYVLHMRGGRKGGM